MKLRIILFLFIFCTLITVSPKVRSNECGLFFDNLTSPLCTDARYILFTGAVITAGLYYTKKDTVDKLRRKSLSSKPLERFSKLGEVIGWGYLNGLYILGSFFDGSKKSLQNAEYMAETSAYTLLATLGTKELVSEPRPGFPDELDSFPSGHASMAFAFASAVAARHEWYWGVLSHLVATFISYSRIHDDRHFLHDVTAGATIGMSYAWGIHLNHAKYRKPYWIAFAPTTDGIGLKTVLAYRF